MRIYENFNGNWIFAEGFDATTTSQPLTGETVRLPHTAVELPYNYFDETSYQKAFHLSEGHRCAPRIRRARSLDRVRRRMADSEVFLNGEKITAHRDGYTPFEARLTPHLKPGDNLLTVRSMARRTRKSRPSAA